MNAQAGFDGQIALVTGGARGIGKACVMALAQGGATVVFTYLKNAEAAGQVEAAAGSA